MSEKLTTVESPSARTAVRRSVVRPVRRRVAAALTAVSAAFTVARLGTVAAAVLVAYFAAFVPADLALLLLATVAGVGIAAMIPLVSVVVVVWFVD